MVDMDCNLRVERVCACGPGWSAVRRKAFPSLISSRSLIMHLSHSTELYNSSSGIWYMYMYIPSFDHVTRQVDAMCVAAMQSCSVGYTKTVRDETGDAC